MIFIKYLGDDFKKDEQLFENYGQPNHIYYVYHGFTLDENIHDCVHYEIHLTPEERQRIDKDGYSGLLEVQMFYFPLSFYYFYFIKFTLLYIYF